MGSWGTSSIRRAAIRVGSQPITMTEWEIHEAVMEDIAQHAGWGMVVELIDIPEGYRGRVPSGRYRKDENGVWRRIGPPEEKVTISRTGFK